MFVRYAGVLHLHLGGQVIRRTHERPFFAEGTGWTKASLLQPGDRVLCADGQCVQVEEAYDTGEWETVYNLRVEEDHTYFVGEESWGWSAWVHNTCYEAWVGGSGFELWYNHADVKSYLDDATSRGRDTANHDNARKMFRALHDSYDHLRTSGQKAFAKAFKAQWIELNGNYTDWSVEKARKAFLRTVAQAKQARNTTPLSSTDQSHRKLVAALQVICSYQSGQQGYSRLLELDSKSITIIGKPQRQTQSSAAIEHQRKVAVEATHLAIDGSTAKIYMDTDLNRILKDLGHTVAVPMIGRGLEPDIVRVRTDGKIDIIEIQSDTQSNSSMDGTVALINAYLSAKFPHLVGTPGRWEERICLESEMLGVLLPN